MQDIIDNIEKLISIRNFQQWEQLKKDCLQKEDVQIMGAFENGAIEAINGNYCKKFSSIQYMKNKYPNKYCSE